MSTTTYERFVEIQGTQNWNDRMDALNQLMQDIGASEYIECARRYYRW